MERRGLGLHGPWVSPIGLGCLAMSGGYGSADQDECLRTVRRALDLGVTLLGTADFYGGGRNEELVGRAVRGRRHEAVLATRGGVRSAMPGGPPTVVDGSPRSLREACHDSLRRLGTDHIDLYYLARVDRAVPVEDSVEALAGLVREGKIHHIGLSEASAEHLRRAFAVHPVAALETEYSLWERHVEDGILDTARALGVGFVAHTPLGKGLFAGAVTAPDALGEHDHRRNHPRFQGDNLRHNLLLAQEVAAIAAQLSVTPSQVALAWLLGRGDDIVPIPGTRRAAHLEQNVAAASVKLTDAQNARLNTLTERIGVVGGRTPAHRRAPRTA
ncbi:aldo/keto reductase [Streptomyces celluloflavus]|uniref:aldo/keto reductase n=1 Tax=Streptomyces celluloflavus TaxID=58344 RepID=UPI00364DBA7B